MSAPCRLAPRVCRLCHATSSSTLLRRTYASAAGGTTTTASSFGEKSQSVWPQRQPRGEYYDILLRDPIPYSHYTIARPAPSGENPATPAAAEEAASSTTKTATSSSPPARTYETIASRTAYAGGTGADATATAEERARVIFGSRLVGPAERARREAGRTAQSSRIAGVLVPPRPEEPDSCCMSGCVNCVWDLYREEMEEWTAKSNEAKRRLAEEAVAANSSSSSSKGLSTEAPADRPASVDADGGGGGGGAAAAVGEAKIAQDMWTDDLFQNVPVGIREFMKQEKRLKEKHKREGTSGG